MTLDESIQGMRLQVIRRAAELENVTAACREAGISRTLFYRWQDQLTLYGSTGCTRGAAQADPARCRGSRRSPSGRSSPWRSHTRRGAVGAWPPTSRVGGD